MLPFLAGAVSSFILAGSALPMLAKAARTRDLSSYSLSSILLSSVGNALYALYVVHLPLGPVWALQAFSLVSSGLMLTWYLRYQWWPQQRQQRARTRITSGGPL